MPYPVEITGGQSFGERQGLDLSLYRILQILSVTVFEKICILGGGNFSEEFPDVESCMQLSLFDF